MAGIFFYDKSYNIAPDSVKNTFKKLDYREGKFLQMGDWITLLFSKKNYLINNWLEKEDDIICCIGTFAYKGFVYEKSLPVIYNDLKNNRLDVTEFWGSFLVLAYVNGVFAAIKDGAGLTRLYSAFNEQVFSTSFAALVETSSSKLAFDRDAATELLATGVLTGSRTLIKEVQRIIIGQNLKKLKIIESQAKTYNAPKSRKNALNQQIDIAREYFGNVTKDWLNYMPESVLDVGITGGMDSRLSAALILKQKQKTVLNTHWRKAQEKDRDFFCAIKFSEITGIPIHLNEVIAPMDMSEDQLMNNFEEAYKLSDGVIRPGCYWDEAYSTYNYRSGITKIPYLRFLGFGGEQYRNGERLPLKSERTLKSWIKWEMNYQFAGRYFKSEHAARLIEAQIEQNLTGQLGHDKLNLYSFKDYIRLVQSPSYRSLQASMENKLGFCLNPFLDTNLSVTSRLAIPFLGKSLSFQLDMIKSISPDLLDIPNNYGFNFSKGEPLKLKIADTLWQELPPWIKHPVYAKMNNYFRTQYIPKLSEKNKFIQDLENIILGLSLNLDMAKYRLVRSRSRLALNLGYFLKRNEKFIHF
jgi:hypothetical protein